MDYHEPTPVKEPFELPAANGLELLFNPETGDITFILKSDGDRVIGVTVPKDRAREVAYHILKYVGADA